MTSCCCCFLKSRILEKLFSVKIDDFLAGLSENLQPQMFQKKKQEKFKQRAIIFFEESFKGPKIYRISFYKNRSLY